MVALADTGFGNRFRLAVHVVILKKMREWFPKTKLVGAVIVADRMGDPYNKAAYLEAIAAIAPLCDEVMIMQSNGLMSLKGKALVAALAELCAACPKPVVIHELDTKFAAFARLLTKEEWLGILQIANVVAVKTSELTAGFGYWHRLQLIEESGRPIQLRSGNDHAVKTAFKYAPKKVNVRPAALMGFATAVPGLMAIAAKLRAENSPLFDLLADELDAIANLIFLPEGTLSKIYVGGYRDALRIWLEEIGALPMDETMIHPECLPDDYRAESFRNVIKGALLRFRANVEALGFSVC